MKFLVYHATGTMFLESIKEKGLIAMNLDEQFEVRKALIYLLECIPHEYLDEHSSEFTSEVHTSYTVFKYFIKQDNRLFQHGNLYVTTSLSKAKEFALARQKASELLTSTFNLYTFCENNQWFGDSEKGDKFREKFKKLFLQLQQENRPIILAFETDINSVEPEEGVIKEKFIEWFETSLGTEEAREETPESLRVISPDCISPSEITLYEFTTEGDVLPHKLVD